MIDTTSLLLISILIFFVAALYSSVGHGGASGYLAVLSFFAVTPALMSSTALVLNVLVAGIGTISFLRAGHFSFRFSWPFILLSVPAAFLGGLVRVSDDLFFLLLAGVLLVAAYRLAGGGLAGKPEMEIRSPSRAVTLPVGAGIGLLSGVVGVGGGIFLSPMTMLFHWATAKQTAALSAFFIVVNSLAGLAGRMARGGIMLEGLAPLVLAAFLGGLLGSYFGANKFSGLLLRRLLALVLLTAALKLIYTSL
ncbi:MAG: sulfite exporter TauE/SafE family protein [Ignavibacteriales bacterium]|nr:sulfite exporter TauE/SafE family protein [Ignavibacteriales bacterium]